MALLLCILLVAALCVLLLRHIALKRQLRGWANDIRRIKPGPSNEQLRLTTSDKDAQTLARAINGLYGQVWQERASHAEELQKLQRGMADISHDLRTPLTSIKGYLGLMAKPGTSAAQREEYLQTAQAKTDALAALVDMLFLHARLEAGDLTLDMQPQDLNAAISEGLAGHYTAFVQAGQQPDVQLCATPLQIYADAGGLGRILANLLGNSLRHGSGEIAVKSWSRNGRAWLRVTNLAPHLTEADVQNLFERSYVPDKARTGEKSGLGLAIVRQFATQMGGSTEAALQNGRLAITLSWPLCK